MKFLKWLILGLLGLTQAGCSLVPGNSTATPLPPEPVFTSAAQTAVARITETAQVLETAAPTPGSTRTAPASATSARPSATATLSGPRGEDKAAFIADVTIPDGTQFNAGTGFTKTWRLQNVGTSTWTPEFALVFVSGTPMGTTEVVALPGNVPPNTTIDLSVSLTAPSDTGLQRSFWKLRSPEGELFGVGANNEQAFYVEINVSGSGSSSGGPTVTAPPSGSTFIRGISLSADSTQIEATCPYVFSFTANVDMKKASRVTFQLEAGSNTPGYQFFLPGPSSFDYGVGTYQATYSLELGDTVDGWVQVRTTFPDMVLSNQLAFSLICQ